MADYEVELNIPGTEKCLFSFYFWHPTLVRPARKRLFCLKAKNTLGRFASSALPHYNMYMAERPSELPSLYSRVRKGAPKQNSSCAVSVLFHTRYIGCHVRCQDVPVIRAWTRAKQGARIIPYAVGARSPCRVSQGLFWPKDTAFSVGAVSYHRSNSGSLYSTVPGPL